MRDINLIVVHHSASALTTTTKEIARWHLKGFKLGIGYHRVIESDGMIYDGRKLQRVGAHAPPNAHSIGICVVGNNTLPDQKWTRKQEASLADLLRFLSTYFKEAKACGHRDVPGASTLCPGIDMREWLVAMGLSRLVM